MAQTQLIAATQADTAAPIQRRQFLGHLAAMGFAASAWPDLALAVTEVWEEGDPICAVAQWPLKEPDGYQLDVALLDSFTALSEILIGVAPLDRQMANQFLERFAHNRQLTKNLNLLIQAYRAINSGTGRPTEDQVQQLIMMSGDSTVRAGAKQLMYLWYVSAFYVPIEAAPSADPAPLPPLQDDPTDTRKRVWVYGTPEQYQRALLWSVIRAHAPMTPGGGPKNWTGVPVG